MARARWTLDARLDYQNILAFIATLSPQNARLVGRRIRDAIVLLEGFPRSGRAVPEVEDEAIREVIVGSYRIFYRVSDIGELAVIGIVDGRRDFPSFYERFQTNN